jgi:hypothetical protein
MCQQPQSVVEWTTFFNYLDISDQVRFHIDDDTVNSFNLIDTPQRDSASVEENDARIQQHPPDHTVWSSTKSSSSSGTNLGRDIHWTVAHGRMRRDVSTKVAGTFESWNDEEDVTLYRPLLFQFPGQFDSGTRMRAISRWEFHHESHSDLR